MASDQFIHYSIQELAGGVFALIAAPGGAAHSNSALVDLGGQTLVFDTGETVIAGRELQNISRHLTGRNATMVVNSHAHLDHWLGNQVFLPTARIYASPDTIKQMPSLVEEVMGELHDLEKIKTELKDELQGLKEKLKTENNYEQQAAIKLNISSKAYELDSVDEQQCCPANTEVRGSLKIEGSQRSCLLRETQGHTPGDVYLQLIEEKVLLMGDLGFLQCHPFIIGCDPQKWIAQLRKFESMPIDFFVPGHGPVGNRADIANLRKYIETLVSRVVDAVRNGKSEQDVLQTQLPDPFNSWKTGAARYERSVHHLFQLFQRSAGNPNTNK
jgi:glyoxylase-like metal-dependent hydrolase (beta-lactamase superfamily II)